MSEQPAHLLTGHVWCKYHCVSCDECFRSIAAFDGHRRGSFYKNTRHCCEPDSVMRADGSPALEGIEGRCRHGNERGIFESTVYRVAGAEG